MDKTTGMTKYVYSLQYYTDDINSGTSEFYFHENDLFSNSLQLYKFTRPVKMPFTNIKTYKHLNSLMNSMICMS